MQLFRGERDWYVLDITTVPAIEGDWEASFDGGTTWITGHPTDDDKWAWLLAGPDFDAAAVGMDAGDTDATITASSVTPQLRIKDNPVLNIEQGQFIHLAT